MKDSTRPQTSRAPEIAVALEDVWVHYGSGWVLEGVTVSVSRGEILGIVGPNGSGKSTLLRVITGLVVPARGSVHVLGRRRRGHEYIPGIGYLPQKTQAISNFPVLALDVVLMGRYPGSGLWGRPGRRDKEKARGLLSMLGIGHLADKPFSRLSGGQQQRVRIAMALACDPQVLILDEPSTGIDVVAQEEFYRLLARLRDQTNLAVIMVSHDIGTITNFADRVACLNRRLHYHGPPEGCWDPSILARMYGANMQVIVHDLHCETCARRHET